MPVRSLLILSLLAVMAVGCGQEATPPAATPVANSNGSSGGEQNAAVAKVAEAFMRSILSGDREAASRWLTQAATQRYGRDPSILSGPGLATAQLTVGEVRLLTEWEAAVQIQVADAGPTSKTELGCLLKREAGGWRVCGLASDTASGDPVVVSFEDGPADPVADPRLVNEETAKGVRSASTSAAGSMR